MQIVIDIPKDVYTEIMAHNRERRASGKSSYYFEGLIQNGEPLPKGHGRLIDADMFLAKNAYFADKDFIDSKYGDTLKDLINQAPTIIKTDVEA